MAFDINNYLTEEKLETILVEVFGTVVRNKQFKPYRFRPDFRLDQEKIVVEFNGPNHFCDPNIISSDYHKKELIQSSGYQLIEIPYFVQLTREVTKFLFGIDGDYSFGFPHGFVNPKAETPSYFCIDGVIRYLKILKVFPNEVLEQCMESLDGTLGVPDYSEISVLLDELKEVL